jgi:resuscitation-promoting factor RpfB
LLESGYPLQDLDYSVPAESDPLPADGKIKVVRVTEQILYEQKTIPYTTDLVPDPELELDQHKVVEEGSVGLQTARIRIRLEDGVEKSRVTEDFVTLRDPVTRQEAYGTKIVYHTIDTPDGPITYYRAITVTATSYSPCNSGVSECLYGTSTSGVSVKKGVIAVRVEWYRLLKGSQMYIPGYGIGTIYDTGYYPYNPMWIDLGFTDAEFKLYGKFYPSITVYFLAPAPANVPAILP